MRRVGVAAGLVCLVFVATVLSWRPAEAADAEYVYIIYADSLGRQAIVERPNGEQYLIEVGVGCLGLWAEKGDTALVVSRGLFGGVGSKLILPDRNEECRILDAEEIDPAPVFRPGGLEYRPVFEDESTLDELLTQLRPISAATERQQASSTEVQPPTVAQEDDGLMWLVFLLAAGAFGVAVWSYRYGKDEKTSAQNRPT